MAKKMYVGNVSYSTTDESLKTLFEGYGEVLSVDIIKDKISGRSKGFAFVKMNQDEDADNAMKSLNGYELDGRKLKVNEARERDDNDRRGNSGGGRFKKFRNNDED